MDLHWKLFWTFVVLVATCAAFTSNSLQKSYPAFSLVVAFVGVGSIIGATICALWGIWA